MPNREDRYDSVSDYEREASRDPGLEAAPGRYENAPSPAELDEIRAEIRAAARRDYAQRRDAPAACDSAGA